MKILSQKMKYIAKISFFKIIYKITDKFDLWKSRNIDISQIETVCLALGPYRNLTTLTALIISLNKSSKVLNHAGSRIFGNNKIDFLKKYDRDTIDRFIKFAIRISSKGQGGDLGGSISLSHAYRTNHNLVNSQNALENGNHPIKCLFWKESHRTSNVIRNRGVDLQKLFKSDERLRFLMPIRNPLDCAVSNLNAGHIKIFNDITKDSPLSEIVSRVLNEIFWVGELKKKYSDRIFYFFEHTLTKEMFSDLISFLKLDQDEEWINKVLTSVKIKPSYNHSDELIQHYNNEIETIKDKLPELYAGLKRFTDY